MNILSEPRFSYTLGCVNLNDSSTTKGLGFLFFPKADALTERGKEPRPCLAGPRACPPGNKESSHRGFGEGSLVGTAAFIELASSLQLVASKLVPCWKPPGSLQVRDLRTYRHPIKKEGPTADLPWLTTYISKLWPSSPAAILAHTVAPTSGRLRVQLEYWKLDPAMMRCPCQDKNSIAWSAWHFPALSATGIRRLTLA